MTTHWSEENSRLVLLSFKRGKTDHAEVVRLAILLHRTEGAVQEHLYNFGALAGENAERDRNTGKSQRSVWKQYACYSAGELEQVVRHDRVADVPDDDDRLNVIAPRDDPREFEAYRRRIRQGQPAFRNALLRLYDQRCAILNSGPPEVLEAAHVREHAECGINDVNNGVLLRADVHALFDADLIAIDPRTLTVHVAPGLRSSPDYGHLNGRPLRPCVHGTHPERSFLAARWEGITWVREPPAGSVIEAHGQCPAPYRSCASTSGAVK